eukprot:5026660-Prymnesium_polylepis.1
MAVVVRQKSLNRMASGGGDPALCVRFHGGLEAKAYMRNSAELQTEAALRAAIVKYMSDLENELIPYFTANGGDGMLLVDRHGNSCSDVYLSSVVNATTQCYELFVRHHGAASPCPAPSREAAHGAPTMCAVTLSRAQIPTSSGASASRRR